METNSLSPAQIAALEYVNTLFKDEEPSIAKLKLAYDEILAANETTKERLDQQLKAVTHDAPIHIEKSIEDLQIASAAIDRFRIEEDQIIDDVCNCVADISPLVTKLTALTVQIRELEKYSRYLTCVAHIEDLSSDIQSALLIKASERAVDQFTAMVCFAQAMHTTKCSNLFAFAKNTITFWYKILQEKLCSEFDDTLKAWQWPFIQVTVKATHMPKANELREELASCFQNLVCLHVPDEMLTQRVASPFSVVMPPGYPTLVLPMQILLKPFQKRFNYHFFTNEKTNRFDKPEWYFTQTLTWIHDHEDFLKTRIQPEFDKAGLHGISTVMEFVRGLVLLVMQKVSHDVELMTTDNLLAHLVDETLAFHRELHSRYGYPDSLPGCLHVLTQPDTFRRWLLIEEKFALTKMDAMLSSNTRLQCQYRNVVDIDESKVSECGETFITLLSTITDRYRSLPSARHQMQFVQLQLELLDDFRVRLVQIRGELQSLTMSPVSPDTCSILNTVGYVLEVLHQWTNQPFFVKLQFYKRQNEGRAPGKLPTSTKHQNMDKMMCESELELSKLDESGIWAGNNELLLDEMLDDEDLLDTIDISLFDDVISLFQVLQDQMLEDIATYVFDDVKARSKAYRNEKWLALPSQKDFLSLALSNSACEMLRVLKDHLHQMEALLSKVLFSLFWQSLAVDLNSFLYKQLIRTNHFNEGGAVQLQFDMTRNLFPLFGAYTAKPENFFKDVKESCLVLSLSAGSALLLRDVLDVSLHQHGDSTPATDPISALHDIGVYKLELEQVEYLLSRRVDINV